MKKKLLFWAGMSLLLSVLFTSCRKDDKPVPLRVGLVTGVGTLNDRGFNQQAYSGLADASRVVNMEWEVRESASVSGIESNIRYFLDKKVDVIITLGYDAAQVTLDAAEANPSVKFLLLDYTFPSLPKNMACVDHKVDQASFPCGFLAAYQACVKNPASPVAGYVAGPDIPTIRQFTLSYAAGVAYFNSKYGRNVLVAGANVPTFTDTLRGAKVADSLIQLGAEVIFACAGKTGNGALYKAKEKGKAAIGVDTDQYLTIPEVGDILITSCMKRLDAAIRTEVIDIVKCKFHGGETLISNLENKGVQLAPYHDFDAKIPDSIRQAVTEIEQGIMDGTIDTGVN